MMRKAQRVPFSAWATKLQEISIRRRIPRMVRMSRTEPKGALVKTLVRLTVVAALLGALVTAPFAEAIHFYRGPGGGCLPASGELTDDDAPSGPVAATVVLGHNSYHDSSSALPVTRIRVGESVRWTWNSAHCHSVSGSGIQSGFYYPTQAPSSPRVVAGFFDYPVLETSPTLAFTHTFNAPGRFTYACIHHAPIGMQGVVIVE